MPKPNIDAGLRFGFTVTISWCSAVPASPARMTNESKFPK
jgi:hypothetical protein